jgi:hypothetical protein
MKKQCRGSLRPGFKAGIQAVEFTGFSGLFELQQCVTVCREEQLATPAGLQ